MSFTIKKSNEFLSFLFAFGITLTITTSLRFGGMPLGFGEILLVLWMILNFFVLIRNKILKINRDLVYLIIFWSIFFLLQLLAIYFNILEANSISSNVYHDLIAYIFVSLISFSIILSTNYSILLNKIKYLYITGFLVFFSLLIISNEVNSIMNLRLIYGHDRFTGGALNPNQLALFVVTMPFLSLYFIKKSKVLIYKLFYFLSLMGYLIIGYSTRSDALLATWILTIAFLLTLLVLKHLSRKNKFLIFSILFIFLSIIFLAELFIGFNITQLIYRIFVSIDSDGSRLTLWLMGLVVGIENFILGNGPGPHLSFFNNGSLSEAHNIFIDLFLQIGFFGLLLIITYFVYIILKVNRFSLLLAIFMSLFIFSQAHFTFRHPLFWTIILSVIQFSYLKIDNIKY